jgi:hypothetical protein
LICTTKKTDLPVDMHYKKTDLSVDMYCKKNGFTR